MLIKKITTGFLLSGVGLLSLATASYAACPAITNTDMMGVAAGAFPNQYELAEFQAAASCTLEFSENPAIADLNAQIRGNGDLAALADRLPSEPLVVAPYASIGQYGGVFKALSNATEAGTSDFLSVRHATLFRYSDDLETIVPNIAKGWAWNADFTQLTVTLRKGHRWSDGAPFTSADVAFWYNNLMMDSKVIENPKDYALAGGKPMTVTAPDAQTVVFDLEASKPGLIEAFTSSFIPPFQPVHFLGRFHPSINADADANAAAVGFETGYEVIKAYYGNSDWTDTPTPMLTGGDNLAKLPADTVPTLESHIAVEETTEGRRYVANPYFHQVDTAGNQLPYINRLVEDYVPDSEVRILKLINGEVTYKAQSVALNSVPVLLDNAEKGGYTVDVRPGISSPTFTFNLTSEDLGKREVFNDLRFRTAMSISMNRDEINEVVAFGLGVPNQYIAFSPRPNFVDEKWVTHETGFDQARANALLDEMGLVDTDGDGSRELLNGDAFVMNFQFSTQTMSAQLVELISQNWADVGVKSSIKEVTPDEFRSAQSANKLDIMSWKMGLPLGATLGDNSRWVPPYGTYFDARTSMLWAEWVDSKGVNGVEPPAWAKSMIDDINALQGAAPGSAAQAEIGERMVATLTGNLLMIGTVNAPEPIYKSNKLQNIIEFKTASYEFYRTYPYLATQWWLGDIQQ